MYKSNEGTNHRGRVSTRKQSIDWWPETESVQPVTEKIYVRYVMDSMTENQYVLKQVW